jgi:molybdopterin converting factor small subunit
MAEVRLFANLREAAGRDSVRLEFSGPPTVCDILERLLLEVPVLGRILYKDGRFDDRYKVLVDSNMVFPEDFGGRTGTHFAILPPVSGG